jgi:hypothetical protein
MNEMPEPTNFKVHEALVEKYSALKKAGKVPVLAREVDVTVKSIQNYFNSNPGQATMRANNLDKLCEVLLGIGYNDAILKYSGNFSMEKYNEYVRTICGSIRILGMNQPIKLEEIYTATKLLRYPRRRIETQILQEINHADVVELERHVITVEEALCQYKRLMIIGLPGAGKTTLLKNLCLLSLDKDVNGERYIPVFVELRSFAFPEEKISLMGKLESIFSEHITDGANVLKECLNDGRILIVLDGLDEVPEAFYNIVYKGIDSLVKSYPRNRFIISCRTKVFSDYKFEEFTDLEIQEFSDEQINDMSHLYFSRSENCGSENSDFSNRFIAELDKYPNVKVLASNPLLLMHLLYNFEYNNGIIAHRKLTLCDETVNILMIEWDRTRRIKRNLELGEHIDRKVLFDLIGYIAYQGSCAEIFKLEWSSFELEDLIRIFVDRIGIKIDPRDILNSLEANYGMIVEVSKGRYSFRHTTFQEFFTAVYIVENRDAKLPGGETLSLEKIVDKFFLNRHWQEIFPLIADRLNNSDSFLKSLFSHVNNLAKEEWLQNYLSWLHERTSCLLKSNNSSAWRARTIAFDLETDLYISRISNSGDDEIAYRFYFHQLIIQMKEFNTKCDKLTYSTPDYIAVLWFIIIYDLAKDAVHPLVDVNSDDDYLMLTNIPNIVKDILKIKQDATAQGELDNLIKYAAQQNFDIGNDHLSRILNHLKATIPKTGDALDLWEVWAENLRKTLIATFQVGYAIDLGCHESKVLEDYIYANNFMMRCLSESVTSSRELREQIVENMLLPPDQVSQSLCE